MPPGIIEENGNTFKPFQDIALNGFLFMTLRLYLWKMEFNEIFL